MNQLDKKDNDDLDKIDSDINFHRIMVFLILVTAIFFYIIFINLEVTTKAQSWGPVGDFFGGILNPIFALFAFYWLTYSVRLQIKELKETREELSKAAKAQKESATHQEEIARLEGKNVKTQAEILAFNKETLKSQQDAATAQQQQIAIQNFESLFFQLLKMKTDVTNDIGVGAESTLKSYARYNQGSANQKISEMISKDHKVMGKESIKDHLILFKTNVLNSWEDFYAKAFLDYAESYFQVVFQIVKLIDENEVLLSLDKIKDKNYSIKQKEYFEIFRATFTQYELEAFFFYCLSNNTNDSFKKILEKYEMFELLQIDTGRPNEKLHRLTRYAYMYNFSVFGNNESWKCYYNNIEEFKKSNFEKLKKDINILYKYKYISVLGNKFLDKFSEVGVPEADKKLLYKSIFYYSENVDLINLEFRLNFRISSLTKSISKLKREADKNGMNNYYESELKSDNDIILDLSSISSFKEILLIINYGIKLQDFIEYFDLK